jgi:two-component system cell cycle sensor histidine kinase/response regulator CckA
MGKKYPVNFEVLKAALSSVPIGVVITDNRSTDNPIVYCNRQFTEITGYQEQEVLNKNCRFLQRANSDPTVVKAMKENLTSGHNFQGELLNYKKDGSPFWNQLTLSPIRNQENEITHFIGFQNDVTRRVKAEYDRESAYLALKKINANLSRFAATLAHDLKTPVSTLALSADMLETLHSKGLKNDELLSTIAKSSRDMVSLIDEVLEHAATGISEKSLVSLDEIVDKALTHFPADIAKFTLIARPLGLINCNKTQMVQVFQNLLSNAFKHTYPVASTIEIASAEGENEWVISISDHGHGVPEDLREIIFEPFFKETPSNLPISSHGIGLATVKGIIEDHHGRIWVASAADGGACFYFSLPK